VRGDGFWIANSWSYSYFHWICDVLPKLELLSSASTPASVIAPALTCIPAAAAACIAAFGVGVEHYAEHGILFNIRYLPDLCPTGNMRPHLMRRIRSRLAKQRARPERWLYATRGANVRGIENEREMMAALGTLGFEMIDWSGLTFAEQVQLASEAAVLVGPHGANLTNCLFMREGALLIELRALGDAHNNCYYALANSVGVQYGYSLHSFTDGGRFLVDMPTLMHDVARLLDLSRQVGA
jgi:capsular polysaccharide biosynthesis protein